MLDNLSRMLVDTLYLVPLQVKRFERKFPGHPILIAGAAKARKMATDSQPKYELGWASARRGVLILTNSGLYCGDWEIPIQSIHNATLVRLRGGSVLKLSTVEGFHYQFGIMHDPAWEKQKVLTIKMQPGQLKLSRLSLCLRLLLIAWLAWSLSQNFAYQVFNFFTVVKIILLIWMSFPFWEILAAKKKSR